MPADQPSTGETWEIQLNTVRGFHGRMAQAVIVEIGTFTGIERVRLLDRNQQAMSYPLDNFLRSWRFLAPPVDEPCAQGTCDNLGFFQVQDNENWAWVCTDHLPAWVMPLLPTDTPQDVSRLPGGIDQCPNCGASTHGQGSTRRAVLTCAVNRCGYCQRQWVLLSRPNEGTGAQLVERIRFATEALESVGLQVETLMGSEAHAPFVFLDCDHEVGTVRLAAHFAPLTVVVMGSLPTGVQRLGGSPDRGRSQEVAAPPALAALEATEATVTSEPGTTIEPAADTAPGEVGDEFVDSKDILVVIAELQATRAIIHPVGSPRARSLIPFARLRAYTKVTRKSAIERLLDDDL